MGNYVCNYMYIGTSLHTCVLHLSPLPTAHPKTATIAPGWCYAESIERFNCHKVARCFTSAGVEKCKEAKSIGMYWVSVSLIEDTQQVLLVMLQVPLKRLSELCELFCELKCLQEQAKERRNEQIYGRRDKCGQVHLRLLQTGLSKASSFRASFSDCSF